MAILRTGREIFSEGRIALLSFLILLVGSISHGAQAPVTEAFKAA